MKITLAVSILVLCAMAGSAMAAQATVEEGLAGTCDQMNWIALNGQVILRVRTPGQEESCLSRKWIIQDRITNALGEPNGPRDVRVAYSNGVPGVYIDNQLIVTADEHDARANGTDSLTLAKTWAANLKKNILQSLPKPYYQAYVGGNEAIDANRTMAKDRTRTSGSETLAIDR